LVTLPALSPPASTLPEPARIFLSTNCAILFSFI
jgi:hypothetical protein